MLGDVDALPSVSRPSSSSVVRKQRIVVEEVGRIVPAAVYGETTSVAMC